MQIHTNINVMSDEVELASTSVGEGEDVVEAARSLLMSFGIDLSKATHIDIESILEEDNGDIVRVDDLPVAKKVRVVVAFLGA